MARRPRAVLQQWNLQWGYHRPRTALLFSDRVRSRDIFVPGQLFAFGSIVLYADSTGHLDQVGNFAPEQEIRFGGLQFVADARGDLIFTGFSASPEEPTNPEALTSDPFPAPVLGAGLGSDLTLSLAPTPVPENQGSPLAEHTPVNDAPELNSRDRPNIDPVDPSILSEMLD